MSIRLEPNSWTYRFARALAVVLLVAVAAAAAQARTKTLSRCNARKVTCSPSSDATAPTVTITAPVAGATLEPATVTVTGTATDDRSVSWVEVQLGSSAVVASGTSSWSATLDLSGLAEGTYGLEARARDSSGNVGRTSISLTVEVPSSPSPSPEPTPIIEPTPTTEPTPAPTAPDGPLGLTEDVLVNQALTQDAVPFGRGRMAADGSRSLLLYHSEFAQDPWAYVADTATGAKSHIRLPSDGLSWNHASYSLSGRDLWVLSGTGPVVIRLLRFDSAGVPTSASLVSSRTFGDGDSRPGELIRLASGGIVAVWHQHGRIGPQGHRVAYLAPGGSSWQIQTFAFMPTHAARDVVAQHPADGAVWIFSNADAWGDIGALRLVEAGSGLTMVSADPHFIDSRYGPYDVDPERPALSLVSDTASGELVLAYQSVVRQRFTSTVIGSYPAIARIDAEGMKSFSQLRVWVERISDLGLGVKNGETWLVYRPIDQTTFRFDELHVARLRSGAWETRSLGTLLQAYDTVHFDPGRLGFAVRQYDGKIHLYS